MNKCYLSSCPLAFIKLKCFSSFGHVNTGDVKSFLNSLKCSPKDRDLGIGILVGCGESEAGQEGRKPRKRC